MRVLVQRVRSAHVTSAPAPGEPGRETGRIAHGLVALVGVTDGDGPAEADWLADKLAGLRIFNDADGAMNHSVQEVGGAVLVVSQFTLYGDTRKGRRPSFVAAARPQAAEPLIDQLVERLGGHGIEVATGAFRTHMEVHLVNDGPVTLLLER
ncbi:MAG: D-tyrosyl-tRNA(Tyr) deacylase [Nitriliruptoraceae bacterium]|nr:D-tyrosyl-tRNA(Tyr) deacylase [Nitriliruptoraceae bacterium]